MSPCAISNDTNGHGLITSDDDVQAVADITNAEEAGRTTGHDNVSNRYGTPAFVSVQIRHFSGTWPNTTISHLNDVRKLEERQCGELYDPEKKQEWRWSSRCGSNFPRCEEQTGKQPISAIL